MPSICFNSAKLQLFTHLAKTLTQFRTLFKENTTFYISPYSISALISNNVFSNNLDNLEQHKQQVFIIRNWKQEVQEIQYINYQSIILSLLYLFCCFLFLLVCGCQSETSDKSVVFKRGISIVLYFATNSVFTPSWQIIALFGWWLWRKRMAVDHWLVAAIHQ